MINARRALWGATALALALALTVADATALAQASSPSKEAVAQATDHFMSGQKLYADQKFAEALVEFRASFAAVPSPNNHLYITRCLRELGQYAAAYDEYAKVIVEAADRAASEPKYAATQKAASEERAALKKKVATLSVTMPTDAAGATMRVGPRAIPQSSWSQEIAVDPGRSTVVVEAPGRARFERDITLAAGEKGQMAVELPAVTETDTSSPADASPHPLRTAAFVSGGVGVAGFVIFGALGASASSAYDELDAKCQGRCGAELQSDVDAGRAKTTGSNVGLAVGILGVGAGVGLFVADLVMKKKPSTQGSAAESQVAITVSPDPRAPGVFAGGRF